MMATVARRKTSRLSKPSLALIPGDAPPVYVPAWAMATLAGFCEWVLSDEAPEHARMTFFEQEVTVDMSPEDPEAHVRLKCAITRKIADCVEASDSGVVYGDGSMLSNPAANLSTVPDAMFVSWEAFATRRIVRVLGKHHAGQVAEFEGTPDWVLEVVSVSTVNKDTVRMPEAYQRAGIPEYWLVNPLGADLDFQVLTLTKSGYVAVPNRAGWRSSPLFGRAFRLTRERDRSGGWMYRLGVKPAIGRRKNKGE